MGDNGSRPDFGEITRNGDAVLAERVRALRLDNKPGVKRDKGGNTWLPWTLVLILAGTWASVGIRAYKSGGLPFVAASNEPAAAAPQATNASQTATNAPQDVEVVAEGASVLKGKGYIIPAHQVSVSPVEVFGRLKELYVEEGKYFKEDEVLAVIDSTSYQADYDEAVAQYAVAKAKAEELENGAREEEVKQMKAEIDESKAMLKRYYLEFERNKGLGRNALAVRDMEIAETDYQSGTARVRKLEQSLALLQPRRERVAQARAELQGAEARKARAQFRLDNCRIRAPISGTILSKKAEIGNLINPVVGGLSTSLCDMANLSDLEVELEIEEREIGKLFVGQKCEVRAYAYPNRKYEGRLDRIMPIANRARGVLTVRVKIVVPKDEENKFLKPEMGAEVVFLNSKAK